MKQFQSKDMIVVGHLEFWCPQVHQLPWVYTPVSFKVMGLFKGVAMDHIGSWGEKSANQGEPLVSVGQGEKGSQGPTKVTVQRQIPLESVRLSQVKVIRYLNPQIFFLFW